MSLRQMIAILRARKGLALLVLACTMAATLAVSLLLPKQYTATAAVVVDMRADPLSSAVSPLATNLAFVATQVDVIKSDRVLLRVMKDLALLDNVELKRQWEIDKGGRGSMQVWLAEQFKRRIDITPSRESNVIAISYTAPDARFAALMANALVKAYMQTAVELRVDPARQYAAFFDNRAKEAREALEAAQAKLSEFQRQHGMVATDERVDIENARLAELSSQLVQLQALSAESGSRKTQSQGPQADRMQEVLNNPLISGLKADLARQETKLQELSAKLGDSHPQLQEARASIAELRNKIEQETRRVTTSVGMANTVQLQRDAAVRADLAAQRERVLKLKSARDEGQLLAREVESAQRSYDGITQRLNQTSIESQSTQSNIAQLSEAVPPNDPSSPKLLLNSALGLLLGLLLALGSAFTLEALKPRVREAADATELLGLPLMGVLLGPGARSAASLQSFK